MQASVRAAPARTQGPRSRSHRAGRPHPMGNRAWTLTPIDLKETGMRHLGQRTGQRMRQRTVWSIAAAAIGLVLVGTACTASSGSASGQTADAASASAYAVSLSDELKITPAMIDAPANTALTFNVTNEGKGQHSFAVQAPGQMYQTALPDGGATAPLEVPGPAAGHHASL